METGRLIELPIRERRKIECTLGVSKSLVSQALSYQRSGEKSEEVREMALRLPEGRQMRYLPECETIHDANGMMRQIFPNGHLLVVDKATGVYRAYFGGEEKGDPSFSGCIDLFKDLEKVQMLVSQV